MFLFYFDCQLYSPCVNDTSKAKQLLYSGSCLLFKRLVLFAQGSGIKMAQVSSKTKKKYFRCYV